MGKYNWESVGKGQQGEEEFITDRLTTIVRGRYGMGEQTVAEIWEDKNGNHTLVTYEPDDENGGEDIIHKQSGTYAELKKKAESRFK